MSEKPKYVQRADGWYTATGYPVTNVGRPDWCARCSKLEHEFQAHDRNWRPSRCAPNSGLCEACGRLERNTRERLAERNLDAAMGNDSFGPSRGGFDVSKIGRRFQ